MIHLGVQNPFGQRLLQNVEQTIGIEYRFRVSTGQQLVEDGVRNMRLFASRHGRAPLLPSCPTPHEIPDSPYRFGCQRVGCDRISLRRASPRRKIAANRLRIRECRLKLRRQCKLAIGIVTMCPSSLPSLHRISLAEPRVVDPGAPFLKRPKVNFRILDRPGSPMRSKAGRKVSNG
jgi:hypothetical protein